MNAQQLVNREIESFVAVRSQMLEFYEDWKASGFPHEGSAGEDGEFSYGSAPFAIKDGDRNYVVLTSDGGVKPLPFGFSTEDNFADADNLIIQNSMSPFSLGGMLRAIPVKEKSVDFSDDDYFVERSAESSAWDVLDIYLESLSLDLSDVALSYLVYRIAETATEIAKGFLAENGMGGFDELLSEEALKESGYSSAEEGFLAVILGNTDIMGPIFSEAMEAAAQAEGDDEEFLGDIDSNYDVSGSELDGLEVRD